MSLAHAYSPFIFTGAILDRCLAALPPQVRAATSMQLLFRNNQSLMLPPGFMALVALFLGAGELVTTPVPKDKQVHRSTRLSPLLCRAHALMQLLQVDWEAILRPNVKEFTAYVDSWFVRQP